MIHFFVMFIQGVLSIKLVGRAQAEILDHIICYQDAPVTESTQIAKMSDCQTKIHTVNQEKMFKL